MNCLTFKEDVVWKTQHQIVPILDGSLHVFKVDVDEQFLSIASQYHTILTPKQLAKSERFKHQKDQRSYVVRKYLTRKLVAGFLNVQEEDVNFERAENSKPIVKGLEFNVSHSGNFILIAISANSVGVDIEFSKQDFEFKSLLPDCFHKEEIVQIESSPDQLGCFYGLWTRKEAVLKATGEGLIEELPKLNCLPDQITRKKESFNLLSFLVEKHYIASIAVSSLVQEISFWNY